MIFTTIIVSQTMAEKGDNNSAKVSANEEESNGRNVVNEVVIPSKIKNFIYYIFYEIFKINY